MAVDVDKLRELLSLAGGEAKARQVMELAYANLAEERRLLERLEARRRGPLDSCLAQIEDRFGAVDQRVREKLDAFPPKALLLTARLLLGCSTRDELLAMLELVESAVSEGILIGFRRALRRTLEQRFGILDASLEHAIELADASTLTACDARLEAADSARSVLAPALELVNR